MARTPRPRVAGVERLLHIPRRGNRVPLDVAALSHSNELLLLVGLVVEDQTVPYAPPLGRRRRGASSEHERDEQREEQQPSTLQHRSLAGIVGRKNDRQVVVESVHQPAKMSDSAADVVARIEGIAHTKPRRRRRHELHKTLCTAVGDGVDVELGFDFDDGSDKVLGHGVLACRLLDVRFDGGGRRVGAQAGYLIRYAQGYLIRYARLRRHVTGDDYQKENAKAEQAPDYDLVRFECSSRGSHRGCTLLNFERPSWPSAGTRDSSVNPASDSAGRRETSGLADATQRT